MARTSAYPRNGMNVMTQPGSAYSLEKREEKPETHTMSVLVDNEPGVLARVIGLFSGRGYNIDSLTVSETEHEAHLSRITIVTSGPPMVIEQIKNQLDRLVPVHSVTDLTLLGNPVERELALVKVAGKGEKRVEALRLAEAFRASVIDASTEHFIFEITGKFSQDRAIHRLDAAARPGRGLAHRPRRHLPRRRADVGQARRHLPIGQGGGTNAPDHRVYTSQGKGTVHARLLRSGCRSQFDQG